MLADFFFFKGTPVRKKLVFRLKKGTGLAKGDSASQMGDSVCQIRGPVFRKGALVWIFQKPGQPF